MRLRVLLAAGLAIATAAGGLAGCSLGSSAGEKHLTAYFTKTTAFYEQSHVKLMGVDVGKIDKITIQGDRIRVDFHVDAGVPVMRNVAASIVPLNLVGERNLVLSPAWTPGQPQAGDGTVIPEDRTSVPVETDDALKAFTNVANALDPAKVKKSLGTAAKSFAGNGDAFNLALQQTGDLTSATAGQTDDLLRVAQNINTLAGVVKGREQVLGTLIQDFSTASRVFADEKGDIQDLVKGVLALLNNGGDLLNKYRGNLPGDLAVLTRVALVLQGDVASLGNLISALPKVSSAFINAYDPQQRSLVLRFALDAFLRTWIRALTKNDGTPCPLPAPNSNCPWMTKGGK